MGSTHGAMIQRLTGAEGDAALLDLFSWAHWAGLPACGPSGSAAVVGPWCLRDCRVQRRARGQYVTLTVTAS